MDGDRQEIVAAVWREHRPFLVDLAFRMLGNIGDAEDVVQTPSPACCGSTRPRSTTGGRGWSSW